MANNRHLIVAITISILLASCSSDDPPGDAFESVFAVTITVEDFDIDVGQTTSSTVTVLVDGTYLPFAPAPNARLIGFENLSRIQLGGRGVVIAGKRDGGIFRVTYAKLLPAVPIDQKLESVNRERKLKELEAVIEALEARVQVEEELMATREYSGDRKEDEKKLEKMKLELRELESQRTAIVKSKLSD